MQSLIAAMMEEEGGGRGAEPDLTALDEALNYRE